MFTRFTNTLPLLPDDIPLMVRQEAADGVAHYDFHVCRGVVRHALWWLKANNKWYQDVAIDERRVEVLLEDGNWEERVAHEEIAFNNNLLDVQQLPQRGMSMLIIRWYSS